MTALRHLSTPERLALALLSGGVLIRLSGDTYVARRPYGRHDVPVSAVAALVDRGLARGISADPWCECVVATEAGHQLACGDHVIAPRRTEAAAVAAVIAAHAMLGGLLVRGVLG